jgi:hypothetical protein
MELERISEYIGLGGFILWTIVERGSSLSGQQKSKGLNSIRDHIG